MWKETDYIRAELDGGHMFFAGSVYDFETFMKYFGWSKSVKIYRFDADEGKYVLIYDKEKTDEDDNTNKKERKK